MVLSLDPASNRFDASQPHCIGEKTGIPPNFARLAFLSLFLALCLLGKKEKTKATILRGTERGGHEPLQLTCKMCYKKTGQGELYEVKVGDTMVDSFFLLVTKNG